MNLALNRLRVALLVTLAAANCSTNSAGEIERFTLADGTPHETAYYVQKASAPGPKVLIVGGIHGNEPAGSHAVDVVRYWPIERGTIISVPRANVKALAANVRRIPDTPKELSDLNRDFPLPDAETPDPPEHPLASALWQILKLHQPDWVFDCHEGHNFHRIDSTSVGNSVIADKKPETQELAKLMLDAVNDGNEIAERQFELRGPPIAGSLTRAASQHLRAKAIILETTSKDQRIPVRARQHRRMLQVALSKLDMLSPEITAETLLTELCDEETIDVGIYDDEGTGGAGRQKIEQQLASRPKIRTFRIDGQDIRSGACDKFDVLVFSGGTGSGQARSLGDKGRERVKQFVDKGGVYIGICAGAYLASSTTGSYGLGLLNVQTKSPLWRRGRAELSVEMTDDGRDLFGPTAEPKRPILYANGPVWKIAEYKSLPEPTVLAWYRTEIAENNTPTGIMVDSPAIVRGTYGKGTAYAFSCHPEQTTGCEEFVFRTIAAARPLEPSPSGRAQGEGACRSEIHFNN
jgi:putative intracellular protease/amidase